MLEEINKLLSKLDEAADFFEEPIFQSGSNLTYIGKDIANYKIIREIGRGGMGIVFLAKRTDGEFEHEVALKIVQQTILDPAIEKYFRRERQILASLNHSNIAKLLDGGVTAEGALFLVMEYVAGETITKFTEAKHLNLDERLQLFLKVCAAVAYAHRNLVVHRDLKPGNILVTPESELKLLDFGLAKLLDVDLSNNVTQTQTAFRALTSAYASPEQLKNEPVTTASDIYSLGIILYELLTNERPFHLEGKSLEQIIKTLTDTLPPLPSTNPSAKNLKLHSDLDNIVLMALRIEPERRYSSVEQFADDIKKYLNGLPVLAHHDTVGYRAGKFIKRHRVSVIATFLILLSLISGTAFSIWQARIAKREKEKAESINAFLEQTFKDSNPILSSLRKKGYETTSSGILDGAAQRLESGEFDASPELKLELEHTISMAYLGQGKYIQAKNHLEQYVLLLKTLYGENHPKMISGSMAWASLLFSKGEFDESEKTYRHYLPLLKNEYQKGNITAEDMALGLDNFAYLRRTQGDSREAESLFRETLDLIPQVPIEARNYIATTRSTLASTISDQGRFDEALQTAQEAVEEYQKRGETDTPSYGFSLTVYGGFLTEKGDYNEADKTLGEAEAIFRKLLPPNALWLGDNLRNQAISFYGHGRYAEAIDRSNETLKIYEESFGKHYDHYPTALIIKGLSLAKTGQAIEGEKLLREAVKIRVESLPEEHFWVAIAQSSLGECLAIQKRYDEAEPLLSNSYESLKNSQGENNPRTILARNRLNKLYEERKNQK